MRNRFFIVRHGESENNVLELYDSHIKNVDRYGLTENGRAQIMSAAENIEKIHKIFTSPFKRTRETAEIFQVHSLADLHIDHRLREIDLGTLHGETHRDLPDLNEDELIFEGESIAEIKDRMMEFITETNQLHEGLNILIVSHGGPIEILRHYLAHDHPFRFKGLAKVPANGKIFELK